MDFLLDLLQGAGIAAAIGIRPFLPVLLTGILFVLKTGIAWDDTKKYLDATSLTDAQRQAVFEDNARRVYPRLDARLGAR